MIKRNPYASANIPDGSITNIKLSSNCVQSVNILNGTILGTDICGNTITGSNIANGTIVRSKFAELTANLTIHNADTSTARLNYKINLISAGPTITAYTNFPMGGVGVGMTHNVRVCIPDITTVIAVEINPDDIIVSSSVVGAGAIQEGTFVDNTLYFTFDPAGYDNIEIGFEVEVDS